MPKVRYGNRFVRYKMQVARVIFGFGSGSTDDMRVGVGPGSTQYIRARTGSGRIALGPGRVKF
jgi:hypothetical protein